MHRGSGGGGASGPAALAGNRLGGEEEWKNIHTMLNCISAMVDKTKRAITILQQRGVETSPVSHPIYPANDTSIAEIKRQTEEKVAEFRRNAEEAVNQVKRQAVIEIQRAVAAAETRAVEAMAQERLKMEKMFAGMCVAAVRFTIGPSMIIECVSLIFFQIYTRADPTTEVTDNHPPFPAARIHVGIVAAKPMKHVRVVIWRDIVGRFVSTRIGNNIIRYVE